MDVVILTYESVEANLIITHLLKQTKDFRISLIIKSSVAVYKKNTWDIIRMILNGVSIHFVFFKLLQASAWKSGQLIAKILGKMYPITTLKSLQREYHFDLIESSDVNQPNVIQQVKKVKPDIILSVYFNQKIGKTLIKIPNKACLNLHPALLPKYRGLFPYFWVLKNKETISGATLHQVTDKFDGGKVVAQEVIVIPKNITAMQLNKLCSEVGAKMLVKYLRNMVHKKLRGQKQGISATYFSWPSNLDYITFRRLNSRLFLWSDIFKLILNPKKI